MVFSATIPDPVQFQIFSENKTSGLARNTMSSYFKFKVGQVRYFSGSQGGDPAIREQSLNRSFLIG